MPIRSNFAGWLTGWIIDGLFDGYKYFLYYELACQTELGTGLR